MARGRKRKEKEVQRNPELEKAEEFLDEKRVIDGEECFWRDKSEVRLLRTLAVEENVANSQDSQTGKKWNPRFVLEAKTELERREVVEKEKVERRKKKEEVRQKLRRPPRKSVNLGTGTRRPLLKSTNTESSGKETMASLFDFPSGSESEEESRRAVSPFEVHTPSESNEDEDEEEEKSKKDPSEDPNTSESEVEVISKMF